MAKQYELEVPWRRRVHIQSRSAPYIQINEEEAKIILTVIGWARYKMDGPATRESVLRFKTGRLASKLLNFRMRVAAAEANAKVTAEVE